VLLFDEPTVGVDPQSRAFLLQAVKKLSQDGCAVIYTSHYMERSRPSPIAWLSSTRDACCQGALPDLLSASGTQLQLAVEGGEEETPAGTVGAFGSVTRHGNACCSPARGAACRSHRGSGAAGLVVSHAVLAMRSGAAIHVADTPLLAGLNMTTLHMFLA